MESMKEAIKELKLADSAGDTYGVLINIGMLLEADFDRSVKMAVYGAKNFLKDGILTGEYAGAFWASDLPIRFGRQFVDQPLYSKNFWRGCFNACPIPTTVLEHLAVAAPLKFTRAVRRSRIFRNDELWRIIRSVLESQEQTDFVDSCEKIRSLKVTENKRIAQFHPLLERVSPETLVVHFSAWLEKQYFLAGNERLFGRKVPEYMEVLSECLNRGMHCRRNRAPKTIIEIESEIKHLINKLKREWEPETFALFECVDAWLGADWKEEMFSAHDWKVSSNAEATEVSPENKAAGEGWSIAVNKFLVMDIFEQNLIHHPSEVKLIENFRQAANEVTTWAFWQNWTSNRFLNDTCGEEVLRAVDTELGFSVRDALMILHMQRACYETQFFEFRRKAKERGYSYQISWAVPISTSEIKFFMDEVRSRSGAAFRAPLEPRSFEEFERVVLGFPATRNIPKPSIRKIYNFFAQDIHVRIDSFDEKFLLQNTHCYFLLTRFFTGDPKSFVLNKIFSSQSAAISQRFEAKLGRMFESGGFSVAVAENLGQECEIDVCAYQDQILFIVEAKVTYFRQWTRNVSPFREALEKGATQLDRIRRALPDHWNRLCQKLNAPEDIDKISVIPILVSNSMEFDHQYFGTYLKVSAFELEQTLANSPFVACQLAQFLQLNSSDEACAAEIVQKFAAMSQEDRETELTRFRLFASDRPTAADLMEALAESRFWSKIFNKQFELTPLVP